eukprot:9270536-Prorocentrum_lima.AAC.1
MARRRSPTPGVTPGVGDRHGWSCCWSPRCIPATWLRAPAANCRWRRNVWRPGCGRPRPGP